MADRSRSQRQAKQRRRDTDRAASLQPDRPAVLSLVSQQSLAARTGEQVPAAVNAPSPAVGIEIKELRQFGYNFAQLQQPTEIKASRPLRQDHTGLVRRRPALQLRRHSGSRSRRPSFIASQVKRVQEALDRADFVAQDTGAFYILNGLNPSHLIQTLQALGSLCRSRLLENTYQTEGIFDRPRIESALRSVSSGAGVSGRQGIELLDDMRSTIDRLKDHVLSQLGVGKEPQQGVLEPIFTHLTGQSRISLISVLRTLPRQNLKTLRLVIGFAPENSRTMIGEVIDDLLGNGTNLTADDVIEVENLRGLNRTMANIYNTKGQYLEEKARSLNISTSAAAGIMKVESGGQTFSPKTNRPIIRFENHVFWRLWGQRNQQIFNQHFQFNQKGHKWEGHYWRSTVTSPWETFHGNPVKEWEVVEFAASLSDQETAYRCMSVGAGQIMGFNFTTVGFQSATEMVQAFSRGERTQIGGIFQFIENSNGLTNEIRNNNYDELARRYNGAGQVATYAARIREAAQAYERVTAGKKHVFNP